ncbi:MAG: hypothetical protein AB7U85_05615 [Alphaproteobacteria bacterium]
MSSKVKYHILNLGLGSIFVVSVLLLILSIATLIFITFAPNDEKKVSCTNDLIACINDCSSANQEVISVKKFRCATSCSFNMVKCHFKDII